MFGRMKMTLIMDINHLRRLLLTSVATLMVAISMPAQTVEFLSANHCLVRPDCAKRYLLLPVEEKSEVSNIRLLAQSEVVKTLNVRLATDNVDYYVPLDLMLCGGKPALLDIHINGNSRQNGSAKEYVCWQQIKESDSFDKTNRESLRPTYHHTPSYGWMNDPNGLFYLNGEWHLFYQWNPYGSQWENMHWGHSVSRDLVSWTDLGCAIAPDALGTVFSGCCVVDKNNTAGFGQGAIVALYTSASESQTQSLAYSTDGGRSFAKYEGNPVIVADVPDFRDPHIFWNDEIGAWNLILAAGQEMRIYSSHNLKEWHYESSFGHGYGSHAGVWECPDLFPLTVEGTSEKKWVLLCNINPGGPAGGSATQYFIGSFDGHEFKCETESNVTRWLDYGKDHYATVSFDNVPDGRRVIIGWMSNWQYAGVVPTRQYRSANTIAREPYLFREGGMTYCASRPVREMLQQRGKKLLKTSLTAGKKTVRKSFNAASGAYEIEAKLATKRGEQLTFKLSNSKGEEITFAYNEAEKSFTVGRSKSGETAFSEFFPVDTKATVLGGELTDVRIFIDKSSAEVFLNDGKTVLSNIVFPSEPYNTVTVCGQKGSKVQSLTVYSLTK